MRCVTLTETVPLGAMFKAQRRGTTCEMWTGPPDSLNSVANTVIHCPVGLDRINVESKPLPLTTCGAIQNAPAPSVTDRPFTRITDGPAPSAACARTGPLALIRAANTWEMGANAGQVGVEGRLGFDGRRKSPDGFALTVEDRHTHRHTVG